MDFIFKNNDDSSNGNDNEFDIKETITPEQMGEDEKKIDEDQKKLEEHILKCKDIRNRDNTNLPFNLKNTSLLFENYKKKFVEINKNMNEIVIEIDNIHILMSLSIEKGDFKNIEKYNDDLKKQVQLLKSNNNILSNELYMNSTCIIADCLSQMTS